MEADCPKEHFCNRILTKRTFYQSLLTVCLCCGWGVDESVTLFSTKYITICTNLTDDSFWLVHYCKVERKKLLDTEANMIWVCWVQLSFEASENKHHFVWGILGGGGGSDGLQPLLWTGSWAAHIKITISGIWNHINCCVIILACR